MKIAVIDLGTNTFHLLIAEVSEHSHSIICTHKVPVKLAEGSIDMNHIKEAPYQRGIDALSTFKEIMQVHQPESVNAFATSAIRDAENGAAFVSEAIDKTGLPIRTIDGDKEAELIYYGVRQAIAISDQPVLIMDIGGGSTEFIIANKETILWKQSFLLGVSRMLEKLQPSDPVTPSDINRIESLLKDELQPLLKAVAKFPIDTLIGSSGSFESFAEMIFHEFFHHEAWGERISFTFNIQHVHAIHQKLLSSVLSERLQMKGLDPMRADMIVISSIFINFILQNIPVKNMFLSRYALKEGALWEAMAGC